MSEQVDSEHLSVRIPSIRLDASLATGTCLTVGAAARRLGVAAPTLRSWERRYGLGPSERSTGGHRRYTAEDLARLRTALQLIHRGMPTAAAVEAVREAPVLPPVVPGAGYPGPSGSGRTDVRRGGGPDFNRANRGGHPSGAVPDHAVNPSREDPAGEHQAPYDGASAETPYERTDREAAYDRAQAEWRSYDGGNNGGHWALSGGEYGGLRAVRDFADAEAFDTGQGLAGVEGGDGFARTPDPVNAAGMAFGVPRRQSQRTPEVTTEELFALANAMDSERLTHAIARALDRSGVVDAWTERLAPLLIQVGEQWERTRACVEVEHLASDCVAGALRYHTRRAIERNRPDAAERPVILACLEGEDHALPLLAVAASLAERRVPVRTLGAATPARSLSDAVRRVRPAAVFVWSSAAGTADLPALRGLARTRPTYRLVVGGPGWYEQPPMPERVDSLHEAVAALVSATRTPAQP
ncbi:MerR family transcriptional regulator [Kribbella deserti]|uniref:MerR family transcriptional regulator n=1 Tax=Kribbella deserti TaxID=1926257 RepID=A0ABV6QUK4_9ACTN